MRLHYQFGLIAVLMFSVASNAQDPFAGVPMEDRPSEYIHWTADDFSGWTSEMRQQLQQEEGIFGTEFTYLNALQAADHRPHNVQVIYRSGYTQPEIHEDKWDIYVILDGTGTARIGGRRVNWIEGLSVEEQRPRLEGAREIEVVKGDMVHIPARVWHQMVTEPGQSITYALINVIE